MTQYSDLEKLLMLARETGKIYAGSEVFKIFKELPEGGNGVVFTSGEVQIEIIENAWLEPSAICAIKPEKQNPYYQLANSDFIHGAN